MENEKKFISRKQLIFWVSIACALCLIALIAGFAAGRIFTASQQSSDPSPLPPEARIDKTAAPAQNGTNPASDSKSADSVASLTVGDTVSYYTSLQSAIDAAGTQTATVKLLQNNDERVTIAEGQTLTLDFTGFTFSSVITDCGTLSFVGGTIERGFIAVDSENAKLSVSGGTIEGVYGISGEVAISGGIFWMEPFREWIAEGCIGADNRDPATKDAYPYTVKLDCACYLTVGAESTPFYSVHEAVNAAGENAAVITLNQDYASDEPILIGEKQNITLDCSFYTLKAWREIITAGQFTFAGGTSSINALEITGGTADINGGTIAQAIRISDGTVNINGGEITMPSSTAIQISGGILNINGGVISGNDALYIDDGVKEVNIAGGEITGTIVNFCPSFHISDGKVKGAIIDYHDTTPISGGIFSAAPNEYLLTERYGVVANTDAKTSSDYPYRVVLIDFVTLTIGTDITHYTSLTDALKAAENQPATVRLNKDTAEDIRIANGQTITLDATGHTLSGRITVTGTLNFIGGTVNSDAIAFRVCGGTLHITGGTINAEIAGICLSDGTVGISDGSICAGSVAVWADSGHVNVSGGELSGANGSLLSFADADISVSGGTLNGKIYTLVNSSSDESFYTDP